MTDSSYIGYLRAKFIDCQFANRVFFNTQQIDINRDIENICNIHATLSPQCNPDTMDENTKGCMAFLHMVYISEIWIAESQDKFTDKQIKDITMAVFEGSPKPNNISERIWIKLQNLKAALQCIAEQPFINFDMIMNLHKIIGTGIIPKAGTIRATYASASGTSVCYAPPLKIETRLNTLIKFVNTEISTIGECASSIRVRILLRLSAFFFAEFLKIHPFINGNGRTARFLASIILSPVCVVPISIFGAFSHETYLSILTEAQWADNPAPLATLFLVSAVRTANQANYLMLE